MSHSRLFATPAQPLPAALLAPIAAIAFTASLIVLEALQLHPRATFLLSGPRSLVIAFLVATPAAWLAARFLRRLPRRHAGLGHPGRQR